MSTGVGIFLLVVGAILTWAVDFTVAGLDIHMIGLIFLVAGAATTIMSLILLARGRRASQVTTEQSPTGQTQVRSERVTSDPSAF